MTVGRRMNLAMQVIVSGYFMMQPGLAGRSQGQTQANGQIGTGQHQATNGMPGSVNPDFDTPPSPFRDSARQRMNAERQKKLVSDTQRLLTLANQVKSEAAVAGTQALTPEMLHQMDEIEKLARSVKDKMRS